MIADLLKYNIELRPTVLTIDIAVNLYYKNIFVGTYWYYSKDICTNITGIQQNVSINDFIKIIKLKAFC